MPAERIAPPPHRIIPVTFSRSKSSGGKSSGRTSPEKSDYHATLAWALRDEYELLARTCDAFLHPNELSHFRSLSFERRQRSYLLGRYAAKQALMQLGQFANPAQVEIAAGVFSQPVVRPGMAEPTAVSISHSEHMACALAYHELHPVAIDVEDTVPDRTAVMTTQILPRELERAADAWRSAPNHAAMIWTAKEALSKVLRCGMTCPYELLAVSDLTAEQRMFGGQFENFTQYRFQTWIMGESVLSIVCPRNSIMTVDMEPLIQAMSRRQVPAPI
jgi:4'-phosphopantetheinyl transferase